MSKPVDDLENLRRQAARVGGLEMQLGESRKRESDLEMRIHQLGGQQDPLVPSLANSPKFAKVAALKELCDQKDVEIEQLKDALGRLDGDNEVLGGRIRTLEQALSLQTEKTRKAGDALALADKRAARLEGIHLGEEYHKARALDLQGRLAAVTSATAETVRVEREFAYGKVHTSLERVNYGGKNAFNEIAELNAIFRERAGYG